MIKPIMLLVLFCSIAKAGDVSVVVGERQIVIPNNKFHFQGFPDEPISIIRRKPLLYLMTVGTTTHLMEGKTFETSTPVKRVLEATEKENDFDRDYAGIGSIYINPKGQINGFYHAERHRKGTVSYTGGEKWYGSIGLATSNDNGYNFSRQGQIITGCVPFNPKSGNTSQGVGDPCVCVDDTKKYLYIYYTDHTRFEGRSVIICMARSKIEDNGRPGTWKKYYQGDFVTDGIDGKDTQVANLYGPHVTYLSLLKKYVMVGNRYGIQWCQSDDGIHWSKNVQLVLDGHAVPLPDKPVAMRPHLIIEKMDAKSAVGFLFYSYSPNWGPNGISHHFVKRPITFKLD